MEIHLLRQKYLEFFEKNGHTVIPSASLVPENDPTTLFTGSGMQPLVPYLLGKDHPSGTRLTNSQKCFRAIDIEEVGDNRHTTFFEMLGNWSFGDYFKKEQLSWFFEFLTKEVGISKEKLWVTCFEGDEKLNLPKDTQSAEIWKSLGIPEERIHFYGSKKNWWSRAGVPEAMPPGEPGGPDSEVFYEFTQIEHDKKFGRECHPNCDCGRFLEIGNSVFMQYIKKEDGSFSTLPKQNVDFGGGLERIAAASLNNPDIFKIDAFEGARKVLEVLREVDYGKDRAFTYGMRVILDHLRTVVFLVADGVLPSNKDQGYFVRRLIRRTVRYAKKLNIQGDYMRRVADAYIRNYERAYPVLLEKRDFILSALEAEEKKFVSSLEKGLHEFEKISSKGALSGKDVFDLFTTYGFPLELTEELVMEKGGKIDRQAFEKEFKKHQDLSRTASSGKFKGGLADTSEKTTMLHTATHLMLAGLRKYLGPEVHQAGSNITEERTRFDFTYPKKVDPEILRQVETYVNEAIAKKCSVEIKVMEKEKAKTAGVEGSFWERYPEQVNVYQVKSEDGTVYSQELCGGPHVSNTGTIEGSFKIIKEEATSAGVRRIKAILE